jgi:beta-glucanase (GH16 family)
VNKQNLNQIILKKNQAQKHCKFLFIFFITALNAQVGQVIWEDDFNSLNTELWNVDIGDGCPELCGWGNSELQSYQNNNVYVEEIPGEEGNFALVLEAKKEKTGNSAFTSGKVTTKNKLGIKYGMVEFRIKVANDQSKGLWPAAWLLGTNIDAVNWPYCGEIDMMEMGHGTQFRNEQELPNTNENTLIGGNLIFYSDDACSNDNQDCAASIAFDKWYNEPYTSKTTLTDRFMIYRMYWDDNEIRLTMEDRGAVHNLYTGPFPIGAEASEFKKPFYLLLNLAVGGSFTDASSPSQVTADLPGKMYIDYVRVKKWNGKGTVYTPEKLMANAGADMKLAAGETLSLDASGSYGPIASYSWIVDGEEVSVKREDELTLDRGDYIVKLKIYDADGNTAEDEIIVTVGGQEIGEVIWEDQFDALSTETWNVSAGNGCEEGLCGWGNQELETYQEDNVYVEEIPGEPGNFALVLEAKKETVGTNNFTSGKVTTENKLAIQYGVVEVRMKVPDLANGLWPAAWLLGIDHRTAGWPQSGEIDMMEMGHDQAERNAEGFFGSPNNFVRANLIWYADAACSPDNPGCAASIAFDKYYTTPYTPSSPMNNRFITYRMYWNESKIRLTAVDNGIEHDLYTNPFPIGSKEKVFRQPFYFIMNLAVGGNFVGLTSENQITAPFPSKMYIDYVKVSKWNGQGKVFQSEGKLLANAGANLILEDLDKDGFETANLDGSASYGAGVSYEWSENGVVLSQDEKPMLSFNPGIHNLQLKITDTSGNTSVDDVKITVREVLWEENFNSFDTNLWNTDIGNGCEEGLCGWGNQELEYYQSENVYVEAIPNEENNSALVIEAKREAVDEYAFTSGKVTTKGKVSVRYGLVEARVKVPNDLSTGLWPAFWLLGSNIDEVGWPKSGEIDMMEMGHGREFREREEFPEATENDIVGGNIIFYSEDACGGSADCAASIAYDKWYNNPYSRNASLTNRFLTYRMYWDPNEIKLTVEDRGVEYGLYTGPFPLGMEAQEFHKPFYLIANLAVGGNFTDARSPSQVNATLPGKMLVDYIRIFKHNGFGEVSVGGGLIPNAGPDIIQIDENKDGVEKIVLDGSGSNNHNGEISSYLWTIDGLVVGDKAFVSVELARGTYEAILTVEDSEGNKAIDVVVVTISNGGLAPVASAGEDITINDDDEDDLVMVAFDGSASEATNAPISSYRWLENETELATGVQAQVELSTGVHVITLEVKDEDEAIGTDELIVTVVDPDNNPPIAIAGSNIVLNDDNGDDLVEVTFDGSTSTDQDGTIEVYEWFLDGALIATGINPSVNLSTGMYEVSLKITDDDGVSATDKVQVQLIDPDNQIPSALVGDDILIVDADLDGFESYVLNGENSSDVDGTILSYVWKEAGVVLGEGIQFETELSLGAHTIVLEAIDDDGEKGTDEIVITINQLPLADSGGDIRQEDTDLNGNETVQLSASNSSDADGDIVAFSWMYDGVEIGNTEASSFIFEIGAHEIVLNVTDNFGSTAIDEFTVFVANTNNNTPVANAGDDFEEIEDDGDGFLEVRMDASASTDSDGEIFRYQWYKNEQLIAEGVDPLVNLAVGEHVLDLIVTDNEGSMATDQITITVKQRVNLALNKEVVASSKEGDLYKEAYAVDGDAESRWASSFSDPQWIYVDLGATYQVNQVILNWESAYASAYEVQVSHNACSWETVRSEFLANGEIDELDISGIGRYVRIYGTARGTEYGYSLFELEVYGEPVAADYDPGDIDDSECEDTNNGGGGNTGSSADACSGQSLEADQGSFNTGYKYNFVTNGSSVNITFEILDADKQSAAVYLWKKSPFAEQQMMSIGGGKFSTTITGLTLNETISYACKFAFTNGMAVTKYIDYVVGTECNISVGEDSDGDGVSDTFDSCPNTPSGASVDANGCEIFVLSSDAITIQVKSPSCIDEANGAINIKALDRDHDYTVYLDGALEETLNSENQYAAELTGFAAGDYDLCIKVDGVANYKRCYGVTIEEPLPLSAVSRVDEASKKLEVDLSGASEYRIVLNGASFTTQESELILDLKAGENTFEVSGDQECQGVYSKNIFLSEEVKIHPNPTTGRVQLYVPYEEGNILVTVNLLTGTKVHQQVYNVSEERVISLDLSPFPSGIYFVSLKGDSINAYQKIVKK